MLSLYLTHPDRQEGEQVGIVEFYLYFFALFLSHHVPIGGGGTAAWVLFCGSGRNRDRDQDLHRHDRGHGPGHLGAPRQRPQRDHQDEPFHRGGRICICIWS